MAYFLQGGQHKSTLQRTALHPTLAIPDSTKSHPLASTSQCWGERCAPLLHCSCYCNAVQLQANHPASLGLVLIADMGVTASVQSSHLYWEVTWAVTVMGTVSTGFF